MSKRRDQLDNDVAPAEHRPKSVVSLLGQKADPDEAAPHRGNDGPREGSESRPDRAEASGAKAVTAAQASPT